MTDLSFFFIDFFAIKKKRDNNKEMLYLYTRKGC